MIFRYSKYIRYALLLLTVSFALLPSLSAADEGVGQSEEMADAVIETQFGNITLQLFADVAPKHVENFIKLANSQFYDGTLFHRVIPDFMIQGGDPNSKNADRGVHGTGGPGYAVKAEFSDLAHERGIVSMARSSDPDSAGSQFFIVVKTANFLDGQYTVFGKVISGMEVVDQIVMQARDARDNPLQPVAMKVRTIAAP